jgi:hypothetical protein
MMKQIRLPMAKHATNSHRLNEIWKADGLEFKEVTQVLGTNWDTEPDTLSIDPRYVTEGHIEGLATKRQVLRLTARLYDPPLAYYRRYSLLGNYYSRTRGADE